MYLSEEANMVENAVKPHCNDVTLKLILTHEPQKEDNSIPVSNDR